MRNKKLWFIIVAIMLVIVSMTFVFTACHDTKPKPPIGGGGGDGDEGVIEEPEVSEKIGATALFDKIKAGISLPTKVAHVDLYADVRVDGAIFRLEAYVNLISAKQNQVYFEVKKLGTKTMEAENKAKKKAASSESFDGSASDSGSANKILQDYDLTLANTAEDVVAFGFYVHNANAFINLGDGLPVIRLDDFNMNYVIGLIQNVLGLVGNLGASGIPIDMIVGIVVDMLFPEKASLVEENGLSTYTMPLAVNAFLAQINGLLDSFNINGLIDGLLAGIGGKLNFQISDIVNHIVNVVPKLDLQMKTVFKGAALDGISLVVKDMEPGANNGKELFAIGGNIKITDKVEDVIMPEIKEYRPFSFTNLNFDIDLKANNSIGADGKKAKVDVGAIVNSFMPQKDAAGNIAKPLLPENLIMLDINAGFRLSVAIDLNLNYEKSDVDTNLIAIELFILGANGEPEALPALGMYYQGGSAYLNLGNLAPAYWKSTNIKINANLDEIVQFIVESVLKAVDKGLPGLNGHQYFNAVSATSANAPKIASMFDNAVKNNEVLNMTLAAGEVPVISTGVSSFVNTLIALLVTNGAPQDFIVMDANHLTINFSNKLLDALGKVIGMKIPFSLPASLGNIKLVAHFTQERPLESITASVNVGGVDAEVKIHNMAVGFVNKELEQRVKDGIKNSANYTDDLGTILERVLSNAQLGGEIVATIKKGTYDLAPLLAGIGLSFLKDGKDADGKDKFKTVPWKVTDDFTLDLKINVMLALDKKNSANSKFMMELTTEKGIKFGDTNVLVPAKTTLIGIYGFENNVYVDLSGFKILNIQMPKVVVPNMDFTKMLFSALDKVKFNLSDQLSVVLNKLLHPAPPVVPPISGGGGKAPAAVGDGVTADTVFERVDGGSNVENVGLADIKATTAGQILIGISADTISANLTLSSIMTLLTSMGVKGLDLIASLPLNLGANLALSRDKGMTLDFNGDIAPRLKDKLDPTEPDVWIDGGNNLTFGLHIGTPSCPIHIGNATIPDISKKIVDFDQYEQDLIQAVVDTIGKTQIELDVDLKTLSTSIDIQAIINKVMAAYGKSFPIPIKLNLEEGLTQAKLLARVNLDLQNFDKTQVEIAMKYVLNPNEAAAGKEPIKYKNIFSVALYRGSIVIDARGLGLIQFEMVNSAVVDFLMNTIKGLISGFGSMNIADMIFGLLGNLGMSDVVNDKPAIGGNTGKSNVEQAAGDDQTIIGGLDPVYKDMLKHILTSMNSYNGIVSAAFGADTVKAILKSLLGVDIGLDIAADLKVDVFGGEIGLGINLDNGSVDVKATGKIIGGQTFDLNLDLASVPDWNGSVGAAFAEDMLNNLDIGFTIDWKSDTPSARLLGKGGGTQYTRLVIEKLTSTRVLPNVQKYVEARANTFLVTLGFNDSANFQDTSKGSFSPFVYILLDPLAKGNNMRVVLVKGWLVAVGFLDIAQFVDLSFALDLKTLLGNLFQGLFDGLTVKNQAFDARQGQPIAPASENVVNASAESIEEKKTNWQDMPKSFDQLFNGMNIVDLFSKRIIGADGKIKEEKGISVTLGSSGDLKLGISLNPYMINSLIDNALQLVFGPNTILDITTADIFPSARGKTFSKNYLQDVCWSRINIETFWYTLKDALLTPGQVAWTKNKGLIVDLVWDLIGINIGMLSAAVEPVVNTVGTIVARLLPLPIISDMEVELNIVQGTIASLSISAMDKFDNPGSTSFGTYDAHGIHVDNDERKPLMTGFQGKSRDNNFVPFSRDRAWARHYNNSNYAAGWGNADGSKPTVAGTYITLMNSSPSVGDPDINGGKAGTITWGGAPSQVTYDPYQYINNAAAAKQSILDKFVGKEVVYQQGKNLFRYTTVVNDITVCAMEKQLDGTWKMPTNPSYQAFSTVELGAEARYAVQIHAYFGSASEKDHYKYAVLNVNPKGEVVVDESPAEGSGNGSENAATIGDIKIKTSFQPISMYVYDQLPLYVYLNVKVGEATVVRKIATSLLTFENYAIACGSVGTPANAPADPSAKLGGWGALKITADTRYAQVRMPNNEVVGIKINYLDSTIEAPVQGKVAKVDLQEFDITTLSKPDRVEYQVDESGNIKKDPTTGRPLYKVPVDYEWTTEEKEKIVNTLIGRNEGNLYYRYVNPEKATNPQSTALGQVGFLEGTWTQSLIDNMVNELMLNKATLTTQEIAKLVGGAEFRMSVKVGTGALQQTVEYTVQITSKTIADISIGGGAVIQVDPYEYYLFKTYEAELAALLASSDTNAANKRRLETEIGVPAVAPTAAVPGGKLGTGLYGAIDAKQLEVDKKQVLINKEADQGVRDRLIAEKATLDQELSTLKTSLSSNKNELERLLKEWTAFNELTAKVKANNPYPSIVQVNYKDARAPRERIQAFDTEYNELMNNMVTGANTASYRALLAQLAGMTVADFETKTIVKGTPDTLNTANISAMWADKTWVSVNEADYNAAMLMATAEQKAMLSKMIAPQQARHSEELSVIWSSDTNINKDTYNFHNENNTFDKKSLELNRTAYAANDPMDKVTRPDSSYAWNGQKANIKVNINDIRAIYFDEAMTQTMLSFDVFTFNNNKEKHIENIPRMAWIQMINGSVYKLPIAWEDAVWDFVPGDEMQTRQMKLYIGFDPTTYVYGKKGNDKTIANDARFMNSIMQSWTIKFFVQDKKVAGIAMDGSALNANTEYIIDPVQYLFKTTPQYIKDANGKYLDAAFLPQDAPYDHKEYRAFPKQVKVQFTDGSFGMVDAKWENVNGTPFDDSMIMLKGGSGFKVICKLNDAVKYKFEIKFAVLNKATLEVVSEKFTIEYVKDGAMIAAQSQTADQIEEIIKTKNLTSRQYKVYPQLDVDPYDFVKVGNNLTYPKVFKDEMAFRVFEDMYEVAVRYATKAGEPMISKKAQVKGTAGVEAFLKEYEQYKAIVGAGEAGLNDYKHVVKKLYNNYSMAVKWDLSMMSKDQSNNVAYAVLQGAGMSFSYPVEVRVNVDSANPTRVGAPTDILYLERAATSDVTSVTLQMTTWFGTDTPSPWSRILPGTIDLRGLGTDYSAIREADNTILLAGQRIPTGYVLPVGTVLEGTKIISGETVYGAKFGAGSKAPVVNATGTAVGNIPAKGQTFTTETIINTTSDFAKGTDVVLAEEYVVSANDSLTPTRDIVLYDGYGDTRNYVPLLYNEAKNAIVTYVYDAVSKTDIPLLYEDGGIIYYRDIPQNTMAQRGRNADGTAGATVGKVSVTAVAGVYAGLNSGVAASATMFARGVAVTLDNTALEREVTIMYGTELEFKLAAKIKIHLYN